MPQAAASPRARSPPRRRPPGAAASLHRRKPARPARRAPFRLFDPRPRLSGAVRRGGGMWPSSGGAWVGWGAGAGGQGEGGRRSLTVQCKKWPSGSGSGEQGVRPGVFVAQETAALLQRGKANAGQSARQPRTQSPSRRTPPKPRARRKAHSHPRGRSKRRLPGDPPRPPLRGAPPPVDGAHGGASPPPPKHSPRGGTEAADASWDLRMASRMVVRKEEKKYVMMLYTTIIVVATGAWRAVRPAPRPCSGPRGPQGPQHSGRRTLRWLRHAVRGEGRSAARACRSTCRRRSS